MMPDEVFPYEIGAFVFAKVKGSCPWPARVRKLQKRNGVNWHLVKFYGTSDSRWVPEANIYPYNRYTRNRVNVKKKQFVLAIAQIEEDIAAESENAEACKK